MSRYQLARPERELRWYPRGAWLGWRPVGSPLAAEFDAPEEVDAIIDRVRRCGSVIAGDIALSASGDSWDAFCHDHGTEAFFTQWKPVDSSGVPVRIVSAKPTRSQVEQEKWEAEQRERRRIKQAEQDRLWAEEHQRRVDAHQAQRDALIAAMQQAADQVKGSVYEPLLLPDLLRDIATIREHPPGPSRFNVDPVLFQQKFARRWQAAGAT
jgi:hypothetical protein